MANVIYHIPWKIKEGRKSATAVRPLEMLKAFQEKGHNIDIVMGSSSERFDAISSIKSKLKDGYKYDFIYSESSVAPTFIASGWKDYIKYGSIDFKFLKYCRKQSIPLTLFYRDIYWKYPRHTNDSTFIKKIIMQIAYRLDLVWYKKWVNILYLPSLKMTKLLGSYNFITKELHPGGNTLKTSKDSSTQSEKIKLNLFYVGGATGGYKLHKLFKVVSEMPEVKLVFCTREKEWNSVSNEYVKASNIEVVHKSGAELDLEYEKSDIALMFFESDEYRSFSMPVKMFESVSYLKPIIATKNTAAGEWVKENNAGWSIEYDEAILKSLLNEIINSPNIIDSIRENLIKLKDNNLWISRVDQIVEDIKEC